MYEFAFIRIIDASFYCDNPSVSFADSSLYTREPFACATPLVSSINRNLSHHTYFVYNRGTTTRSGREGSRGGRLCAERCSDETLNETIGTIGQRLPVSPSLVPFLARQERYAPRSGENRFDVSSHNSLGKNTSSAPSGHLPLKGKALVQCFVQTDRSIEIFCTE